MLLVWPSLRGHQCYLSFTFSPPLALPRAHLEHTQTPAQCGHGEQADAARVNSTLQRHAIASAAIASATIASAAAIVCSCGVRIV